LPLNILLILVVGGIAAIAALLHILGKSRQTVLSDEDARSAWHRHFPDDEILGLIVARDGHAALVQTGQGPGLLWSFGADTVARHLRDFDLLEEPNHLRVIFHDFTAPSVNLHLSDTERAAWKRKMNSE
jgi:hypothetical protein